MSMIVLKVKRALDGWAVMHRQVSVATFKTRAEAEKAALALAVHHPSRDTVELDFVRDDNLPSAIKVF